MKMNIQFFAGEGKEKDNIKALRENRAEKVEELKLLYATLEAEERAVTDDEEKRAETLDDEIKRIDKTIHILEDMKKNIEERGEREDPEIDPDPEKEEEKRAEEEEKAFADYLRGVVTDEHRAAITRFLPHMGKQVIFMVSTGDLTEKYQNELKPYRK